MEKRPFITVVEYKTMFVIVTTTDVIFHDHARSSDPLFSVIVREVS